MDLNRSYDPAPPAADSAANSTFVDVIGSKSDTHDGDSIYAHVETLNDHVHKASKVYPTLAGGTVVTAGAAWTLGAFAEVVPASTIGTDFDIHHICIEALSAVEVYEIVLYAATTEIGRVRVVKTANLEGTQNIPIQTPIIAADTQIQAKVATAGGADTATISLFYHVY